MLGHPKTPAALLLALSHRHALSCPVEKAPWQEAKRLPDNSQAGTGALSATRHKGQNPPTSV